MPPHWLAAGVVGLALLALAAAPAHAQLLGMGGSPMAGAPMMGAGSTGYGAGGMAGSPNSTMSSGGAAGPGMMGGMMSPQFNNALSDFQSQHSFSSLENNPTASQALDTARSELNNKNPVTRFEALDKLRKVDSPDIAQFLIRQMGNKDENIRIKAIDLLGAHATDAAVSPMTKLLFLQGTSLVEKRHIVAALGRVGDRKATLAVIEFLRLAKDTDSRGTAIYALGELADPRASDVLIEAFNSDHNPRIKQLTREALAKVDGEAPSRHAVRAVDRQMSELQPTDQRLANLRAMFDQQNGPTPPRTLGGPGQ
jgi:hypothetical protein